ncbi:segregation and condensation protein A [Pullulanibacillus pueri]|uniref:Segregation and condensation protein A n=1 Tax=Pullulanibacillus pueri TaxID=1437324 RepID=A0A8J2ZUV9_9BACL|nr:segregation/condensation protein A [Pullulanibacillus pueri]MBM7681512.1 segregation and condensation protein A [Pullulanibacillus pueri]GGH79176.1 segregation and condensation protein A [Pullulanibacillus pueri]
MEYKVKIDAFEGPLDLLLHLIKKLEIDIYDIPVAVITEQYLEFIHQMKVLQLDVASEYLVMAASLIEMKSRMLLPKQEPLETDFAPFEEEEDPREELVKRLLEYKQYKQAADFLKDREEEQSLVFSKPPHDLSSYKKHSNEVQLSNVSVYDMLSAFRHMLVRKRLEEPLNTKIERQSLPIGPRMKEIVTRLNVSGRSQPFSSLFAYPNSTHVVVTFLAVLELMKNHTIICSQEHNFSEIMITLMEGVAKDER